MKIISKRRFKSAAFAAALFLGVASDPSAQNVTSEKDNFHNTVYINTDSEDVKSGLFLFGQALDSENHSSAVTRILGVLEQDTDALVPLGERTCFSMLETCIRKIAAMPVPALDLYMERADAEARSLLDLYHAPYHDRALKDVASLFPLTQSAFRALLLLGDTAFERGLYLEAVRWYDRFLDESEFLKSGSHKPGPETISRAKFSLYLSLVLCGRGDDARCFRRKNDVVPVGNTIMSSDPDALLKAHGIESGIPEAGGWPTRGGHRSRRRLPGFDCSGLDHCWSYSLNGSRGPEGGSNDLFDPVTLRYVKARRPESTVYPIVDSGVLYVFDEKALHPLDLESGELLYGPLRWDWTLLFGDEDPALECVTYSGTASDGILYAALNRRKRRLDSSGEHHGVLLALDLAREGYMLWRRGGRGASETLLNGVAFSGAPVVLGQRVFILGTRYSGEGEARVEVSLFCFARSDGSLVFSRFLCSGAEVDRFEIRLGTGRASMRDRVEIGSPIAEHNGVLYCLTNLGVVGAVDAFSGGVLWLFKYNRLFSRDPDRYYRDFFLDTGGWRDSLPIIKDERLYAAPRDSRFFYCLTLRPDADGFIILDDPVEKGRKTFFMGMDDELFYFSAREGARNFVLAMDRYHGVRWETPPFESEDRISGRALLTKTALFVPTERYIYRLDLKRKGLITHIFPLPPLLAQRNGVPARFGNVITVGDHLVSVSREDVIVFKAVTK